MPTERPTIASCPFCRAILLRTERSLIHPTGGEREEIERALGEFWIEHTSSRFDGRFHRCIGRERIENSSPVRSSLDECFDCAHPSYRGPHREVRVTAPLRRALLLAAICVSLPVITSAQERSGARWPADDRPPSISTETARSTWTDQNRPAFRRGTSGVSSVSTDEVRVIDRFLTPQAERAPRLLDDQVVRAAHISRQVPFGEMGSTSTPASPGPGSWQGLKLAGGRYQVFDRLREASAGVVYLAHDRNLDADVVVEVPQLPYDHRSEATLRFLHAVRSIASLVHPHLVKVTEVGTLDDTPFVIAEHRAGGSLKFRRPVGQDGRPAPVAPESLTQWLPNVSDALDFLHTRNRLYREVSPANILFDENNQAALGGIGMAQAVAEWTRPESSPMSGNGPGRLNLSPIVAPEIARGEPADGRADQYALAATVYELLSGHPPFQGQTHAEILEKDALNEPPELHQLLPSIPAALSAVVQRGLAPDPRHRFPDCKSFAQAVASATQPTATATATTTAAAPAMGNTTGLEPIVLSREQARATVPQTSRFAPRRVVARLIAVGGQTNLPAKPLAIGLVGCGVIGIVGVTALRLRTQRTCQSDTETSHPTATAVRRVYQQAQDQLPGPSPHDARPRALADAREHRPTVLPSSQVRRHQTEQAGRPHLSQVSALVTSQLTVREIERTNLLNSVPDHPRTPLADHLLPVLVGGSPIEAKPKAGPLALSPRRAC